VRGEGDPFAVCAQVDEEPPVGVAVGDEVRDVDGEAGLADAGHAVDGEHDGRAVAAGAGGGDEPVDDVVAAGEVGDVAGQRPRGRHRHAPAGVRRAGPGAGPGRPVAVRRHGGGLQQAAVQLLQRGGGGQAQLVVEGGGEALVDGDGVGGPPDPGQGRHELPVQPFPQRVLLGEAGELADQLGLQAQLQLDVEAVLQGAVVPLLEGDGGGLDAGAVDAGEGGAAPQLQGVAQVFAGGVRLPGGEGGAAVGDEPVEHEGVEVLVGDPQPVAGGVGVDGAGQPPAQPRHAGVQLGAGGGGCGVAPDGVDQPGQGDDPVGLQQQHDEQDPVAGRGDLQPPAGDGDLERTEQPVTHDANLNAAAGAGYNLAGGVLPACSIARRIGTAARAMNPATKNTSSDTIATR
jgi:hypothetical protein